MNKLKNTINIDTDTSDAYVADVDIEFADDGDEAYTSTMSPEDALKVVPAKINVTNLPGLILKVPLATDNIPHDYISKVKVLLDKLPARFNYLTLKYFGKPNGQILNDLLVQVIKPRKNFFKAVAVVSYGNDLIEHVANMHEVVDRVTVKRFAVDDDDNQALSGEAFTLPDTTDLIELTTALNENYMGCEMRVYTDKAHEISKIGVIYKLIDYAKLICANSVSFFTEGMDDVSIESSVQSIFSKGYKSLSAGPTEVGLVKQMLINGMFVSWCTTKAYDLSATTPTIARIFINPQANVFYDTDEKMVGNINDIIESVKQQDAAANVAALTAAGQAQGIGGQAGSSGGSIMGGLMGGPKNSGSSNNSNTP